MPKIELFSSNRCPFVQRSIAVLEHKAVSYEMTFVDPYDAPDWFKALSPLGKVPVLRIDDKHVLFESAVINEYLDDVTPGSLYPEDPLTRAQHKAWIAFGSESLSATFRLLVAEDKAGLDKAVSDIKTSIERIEPELDSEGPFFAGDSFGLVDAAYAPLFIRLEAYERLLGINLLDDHARTAEWSKALLAMPAVQRAVFEGLDDRFIELMKSRNAYGLSLLGCRS